MYCKVVDSASEKDKNGFAGKELAADSVEKTMEKDNGCGITDKIVLDER